MHPGNDSNGAAVVKKNNVNLIKGYVKETLFKDVKFCSSARHQHWNFDCIARPIMDYLKVPNEPKTRQRTWDEYFIYVKKALNERRNTINGSVKDAVKGTKHLVLYHRNV